MTTKQQLIKEFREKFKHTDKNEVGYVPVFLTEKLEAFLLSTFDAGRASGIEEVKIVCGHDIDGGVCDCCQANYDRIENLKALTPSSSKDN